MSFKIKKRKTYESFFDAGYEMTMEQAIKKIEKNPHAKLQAYDDVFNLNKNDIRNKINKNCFKLGKESKPCHMVCINGSNNSHLAFKKAVQEIDPEGHIILITIRDISKGKRKNSLSARWRLMIAAKQILNEYEEYLHNLNYNHTIFYPESHMGVWQSISYWAKKFSVDQIFIGSDNKNLGKYLKRKDNFTIRTFRVNNSP